MPYVTSPEFAGAVIPGQRDGPISHNPYRKPRYEGPSKIAGYTKQNNITVLPFVRVRLYHRATGLLLRILSSDAAGYFEFTGLSASPFEEYYAVALYPVGVDSYNALIFDKLTPEGRQIRVSGMLLTEFGVPLNTMNIAGNGLANVSLFGGTFVGDAPPNFAKLNSADKDPDITLSNDDLTATQPAQRGFVRATKSKTSSDSKWKFEVYIDKIAHPTEECAIGVATSATANTLWLGIDSTSWGLWNAGLKWTGGASSSSGISYTTGDVVMVAGDPATGKLWFGKNGTWSGDPAAGTGEAFTTSGTIFAAVEPNDSGAGVADAAMTVRFRATHQTYAMPSGFIAYEPL